MCRNIAQMYLLLITISEYGEINTVDKNHTDEKEGGKKESQSVNRMLSVASSAYSLGHVSYALHLQKVTAVIKP